MSRIRIFLYISLVLTTACTMAPTAPAEVKDVKTEQPVNFVASRTPSATRTVAPTTTPQPTPTPTPNPTAAPKVQAAPPLVQPAAEFYGNTKCRSGPGGYYPVVTIVKPGTKASVLGRVDHPDDATNQFVLVQLEDGTTCWAWTRFMHIDGDVLQVPVVQTPTPPPMALSIRYLGSDVCGSQWAIHLELENKGALKILSYQATVYDSTYDRMFTSGPQNYFGDPCHPATGRSTLWPGTKAVVGILAAEDPRDSRLTLHLKACTKRDLLGDCIVRTKTLQP